MQYVFLGAATGTDRSADESSAESGFAFAFCVGGAVEHGTETFICGCTTDALAELRCNAFNMLFNCNTYWAGSTGTVTVTGCPEASPKAPTRGSTEPFVCGTTK